MTHWMLSLVVYIGINVFYVFVGISECFHILVTFSLHILLSMYYKNSNIRDEC